MTPEHDAAERAALALWALDHLLDDAREACVHAVLALPMPRTEAEVAAALRAALRESVARTASLSVPSARAQ